MLCESLLPSLPGISAIFSTTGALVVITVQRVSSPVQHFALISMWRKLTIRCLHYWHCWDCLNCWHGLQCCQGLINEIFPVIFIERFKTFKLGATLRSLLPSLPGSEMRVGSLLKINPSLNVDQEKRQESDDKNWAEARTWTTKEKHHGAKGKPGYNNQDYEIRRSCSRIWGIGYLVLPYFFYVEEFDTVSIRIIERWL